jgi:hypothetical protein
MLQPIYHIVSTFYPVASTAGAIKKGMLVGVDSNGQAAAYNDDNAATTVPVGLAGDTKGTLTAGQFTNRLADMGDQTFASGYITVYSGGEYYVDINQRATGGDADFPCGDVVYDADVAVGDKLSPKGSTAGVLTKNSSATPYGTKPNFMVAVVVDDLAASDYMLPTGIPNENEPSGDSDTPRKFCRIKLVI